MKVSKQNTGKSLPLNLSSYPIRRERGGRKDFSGHLQLRNIYYMSHTCKVHSGENSPLIVCMHFACGHVSLVMGSGMNGYRRRVDVTELVDCFI